MAMLKWLIVLYVQIECIYGMQCLSQSGSSVDWFVVYKIPKQQDNKDPNLKKGAGFYYMDNAKPRLVLSNRGIDDDGQAVYNTLSQVYHNKTAMAYIMYNDHTPDNKVNSYHGHTKGIVAMDTSGGFWIVHSTPKFPPFWSNGYKWGKNGYRNGQTFLCISMPYTEMDKIGTVLMYTYPLIYDKYFPDVFIKDNPTLTSIVLGKRQIHVTKPPWYTVAKLTTRNDDVFFSFAKYTKFERDLYDSLLSAELEEDLLVQSWIESKRHPGDKLGSNCTIPYKVYNIKSVHIPGTNITFPTSKDHSKWAVSKQAGNWLCIGDINRQKVWKIEDILESRGDGEEEEILVKWSDWDGPNTWVRLQFNPELHSYLHLNRANPNSSTMVKVALKKCIPLRFSVNSDCMALRQVIFDSLAEVRYTPDGSMGRQDRITIKLPFREEEFDTNFRALGLEKIPANEKGNVDCYITGQDLTRALGPGWDSRCYHTSTQTYVSFKELIHLSWGYKQRTNFNHSACQRCHFDGKSETARPDMCNPVEEYVVGPPWLQLTFTRARKNMVTGDISKRRKKNK